MIKIYLSEDELKTVINALYSTQGNLERSLKEEPKGGVKEAIEYGIAATEKLISYLTNKRGEP